MFDTMIGTKSDVKRCPVERLAEIIKKCDLKAFNEEYWDKECAHYAAIHEETLGRLTKGTTYHLKNDFDHENMPYPSLLQDSFNCCHHKKAAAFYDMFKREVQNHVRQNLLKKLQPVAQGNMLGYMAPTWEQYKVIIRIFGQVFRHLDEWAKDESNDEIVYEDIQTLAMKCFRDNIVMNDKVQTNLTESLLQVTDEHRKGNIDDFDPIKKIFEMLEMIEFEDNPNMYQKVFEVKFLEQVEKFHKAIASESLSNSSSYEYVLKIEKELELEKGRITEYVKASTVKKTTKLLETTYIKDHLKAIVCDESSGALHMLRNKQEVELESMYKTLKRVDGGLEKLKDCLKEFIAEEGKAAQMNDLPKSYLN